MNYYNQSYSQGTNGGGGGGGGGGGSSPGSYTGPMNVGSGPNYDNPTGELYNAGGGWWYY